MPNPVIESKMLVDDSISRDKNSIGGNVPSHSLPFDILPPRDAGDSLYPKGKELGSSFTQRP